MMKIHPIWWLVGFSVVIGVANGVMKGPQQSSVASSDVQTSQGFPDVEPIPDLGARLARMDGVEDPAEVATYEAVLADIETVCLESREQVSLMAFTLVEKYQEIDFEYTQLEALVEIGSTAEEMGEGRETKCFDAYMESRRGQKAMAEDIEQDQRTPSW